MAECDLDRAFGNAAVQPNDGQSFAALELGTQRSQIVLDLSLRSTHRISSCCEIYGARGRLESIPSGSTIAKSYTT